MLEKLQIVKNRFDEVSDLIIQPEIISDQKQYIQLNKEYKDLRALMDKREQYLLATERVSEAEEILADGSDDEMVEMAKLQMDEAKGKIEKLEEEIKFMLIPKDPEDSKNAVVEVRAGTGGDEASIFAGDLHRMYTKYCENKGWKVSVVDFSEGTSGGYKEIQFEVEGDDVYGTLKYEAGVHRVQRVPQTETQGRVHTGPGGQSVNTTYSAVRLTHEPTGLVAQCQDQKSQHKNKEKAFKVLRSRLFDLELAKKQAEDAEKRGSMVTSGDRSAKIRTYNYPQGRVTDHRINLTLYDLGNIIDGDIQKIIDELQLVSNTEKLKEAGETF